MLSPLASRHNLTALARGRRRAAAGGGSYDADAITLFAAMTSEPDGDRKTLISDTIASLKTAGIWAKLDRLFVLGAHDSQASLLDWKDPTRNATAVNSPTFTVDRGWQGDGSTSYLNSNFAPSTDAVNYTLTDAAFGCYSRTDVSEQSADMHSKGAASGSWSTLQPRWSDGRGYAVVNNTPTSWVIQPHSLATTGLWVAETVSGVTRLLRNAGEVGTSPETPLALADQPFFIGARNNNGSTESFSSRQYAISFLGASLTTTQHTDLQTIMVDGYLATIGAKV